MLLALDDAQWLDRASSRVLLFALRRLEDHACADSPPCARARRGRRRSVLVAAERATSSRTPRTVECRCPLRRAPPRTGALTSPLLKSIARACGGNPFYALEIERALETYGPPESGARLPVPDDLRQLVAERVRPPSPVDARRAARGQRARPAGCRDRRSRRRSDRRSTPASWPSIPRDGSSSSTRCTAPRCTARPGPSADASYTGNWRLARGQRGGAGPPPRPIAPTSRTSRSRPRSTQPLTLPIVAGRPRSRPSSRSRRPGAPRRTALSSETNAFSAAPVTTSEPGAPAGASAGRGSSRRLPVLAHAGPGAPSPWRGAGAADPHAATTLLEEALQHVGDDTALEARLETSLGLLAGAVADAAGVERHLDRAVELAESAGETELLAEAMALRAVLGLTFGDGLDVAALEQALELEDLDREVPFQLRPSLNVAQAYEFAGRPELALPLLGRLRERIAARGEEADLALVFEHLAASAWLAGDLEQAERDASAGIRVAGLTGQDMLRAGTLTIRAIVRATRSDLDAARADAAEALELSERIGWPWGINQARYDLAFIALSEDDPEEAVRIIEPVVADVEAFGIYEWPIAMAVPDAIEALIGTGDREHGVPPHRRAVVVGPAV